MRRFFPFLLSILFIGTNAPAYERMSVCGGVWLGADEITNEIRARGAELVADDPDRKVLHDKILPVIEKLDDPELKHRLSDFVLNMPGKRPIDRMHVILDDEADIEKFLNLSSTKAKSLGTFLHSKIATILRGKIWLYGITAAGTLGIISNIDGMRENGISWKTFMILYFMAPKFFFNLPNIVRGVSQMGTLKKLDATFAKAFQESVDHPEVLSFRTSVTQKFDRAGKPIPFDWNSFNTAVLDAQTPMAMTETYYHGYQGVRWIAKLPMRHFKGDARVDLVFFPEDGRRKLAILLQNEE